MKEAEQPPVAGPLPGFVSHARSTMSSIESLHRTSTVSSSGNVRLPAIKQRNQRDGASNENPYTASEQKRRETRVMIQHRKRLHMFGKPIFAESHQRMLEAKRLCAEWVAVHQRERGESLAFVDYAKELFYNVVVRNHVPLVSNGNDQLCILATRAAVSCFLLEEAVKALPRHEILERCIGMLLRLVYVPNTEEMREALGGTVQYPLLLRQLPDYQVDSPNCMQLSRFARKPYFVAHHELTQRVIMYAHMNLTRQERFRRLPRIFDLLNANWIKSFLRTTLKAWQRVCLRRRQEEQKHRARWARRFAAERIRSIIRQWRVYAQVRVHSAVAAESIMVQIKTLSISTRNLRAEIEALTQESAELSVRLEEKDTEYGELEKKIAEIEGEYKRKLQFVCEIDRVGSKLLSSLAQKVPFPGGTEAMLPLEVLVLWANQTLIEGWMGSLFVDTPDDQFVEQAESYGAGLARSVRLSDISSAELPFTPLLRETTLVFLPMHRFLALISAMDPTTGPTMKEISAVCKMDAQVRPFRMEMEDRVEEDAAADEKRDNVIKLEDEVGRIILEAYTNLTGGPCLISAKQLMTRKRGFQLVFLAGLLRYFTNWVDRTMKPRRSHDERRERSDSIQNSGSVERASPVEVIAPLVVAAAASVTSSIGSNSTIVADEYAGTRHREYPEWFHPPASHLNWMRVVENQQLWIAASFNALHSALNTATEQRPVCTMQVQEETPAYMENVTIRRLSDLLSPEVTADNSFFYSLARCVENALPKLRDLFMQYSLLEGDRDYDRPGTNSLMISDESDVSTGANLTASFGNTQASIHGADGQYFVSSLDFWRLLRDCRVVGGRGKLHRAVVHRIVEKVAHGSASKRKSGRAGEKSSNIPGTRKTRSGKELAEIDLKNSYYKLRLSPPEFVEALLRCAQVWDYMQSVQHREEQQLSRNMTVTSRTSSEEAESSLSQSALVSERLTPNPSPPRKLGLADRMNGRDANLQGAVSYPAHDPSWLLRPAAVHQFLNEYIIVHGFRGPTLDPFQRAKRHLLLRQQFAEHAEVLFAIFCHYAKPREGYGIRPPDNETSSRGQSSSNVAPSSRDGGSQAWRGVGGTPRDRGEVGIVRVMTLGSLQAMTVGFSWYSIRRVTPDIIESSFHAVVADPENEPGVLFYPEWLDFLCVLAYYFKPNPTEPLHEKMGEFLRTHVIKHHKDVY